MKIFTCLLLALITLFSHKPSSILAHEITPRPSISPAINRQKIEQNRHRIQDIKLNLESIREDIKNKIEKNNQDKKSLQKKLDESKKQQEQLRATLKLEKKSFLSSFRLIRVQAISKRLRLRLTSRYEMRLSLHAALLKKINALTDENEKATATSKLVDFAKYQSSYNLNLETFDKLIAQIPQTENPQSLLPQIQNTSTAIKKDLSDMKKALINTATYLKQIRKPTSPTPTSSPTLSPSPTLAPSPTVTPTASPTSTPTPTPT